MAVRKKLTIGDNKYEMQVVRGKNKLFISDKGENTAAYAVLTEKQWFKLYEWLHGHAEDL